MKQFSDEERKALASDRTSMPASPGIKRLNSELESHKYEFDFSTENLMTNEITVNIISSARSGTDPASCYPSSSSKMPPTPLRLAAELTRLKIM